jgi:hypothetical protein
MEARRALASVLMSVLVAPLATAPAFARSAATGRRDQAGDASRLREQIAHLRAGARIEVRFVNRETVRGRLGAVEPDGFALMPQDRSASERRVAFAEVTSVKAIQSRGKVAVEVGVVVVAAVGVAALVIDLAVRSSLRGLRF